MPKRTLDDRLAGDDAELDTNGVGPADGDDGEGEDAAAMVTGRDEPGVVFILEQASLEIGKVGKTYVLLSSDEHAHFLSKHGKDPAQYRPDIAHQSLLAILDSPVAKAGRLKGLYVVTTKKVIIQVNPQIRLPRTFRRFCGLMVQLLQKLSIRASNGPDKLLRVVKQPVTKYLPVGWRRVGLEYGVKKAVQLRNFLSSVSSPSLVFVVGAMANGDVTADYVDEMIAVSDYPLSAACCLNRICGALELKWSIF